MPRRRGRPKKAPTPRPVKPYARGDLISFRIPLDATDAELACLEALRQTRQGRMPLLSPFFWERVRQEARPPGDHVTLPLPAALSDEQKKRLDDPHVARLLGYWVYQSVGPLAVTGAPPLPSASPALPTQEALPLHNLLRGVYGGA